jgi:creatinine amidohydrolase
MKPPTVFLAQMTRPEIEAFLKHGQTVIVPTGSTEQHGPHGAVGTDAIIPTEICRRMAPQVNALVAPTLSYSLSYPHEGFSGTVFLRMSTFAALIEDLCAQFSTMGFRRIVFLNGHYDNTYAIAYACAAAAERMQPGTHAFPVNYWDGMTADESGEFMHADTGLHANKAETSAVMAINPDWVDMDAANSEMPPFPQVTNQPPVHTAFFFSSPGSVYRATHSGTWGDARDANPEFGEHYIDVATRASVRLLDDIERTFEAMPDR